MCLSHVSNLKRCNIVCKYYCLADLGNISIVTSPSSGRVVEYHNVSVVVQVDCNPTPYSIKIIYKKEPKTSVTNTKELEYVFEAKRADAGRYTVRVIHVSENAERMLDLTVLSKRNNANALHLIFSTCIVGPPSNVQFFVQTITHNSVIYNWTVGMDGNADITKIKLCCGENANEVSHNQCSASAKSRETPVLTSFRSSDTLEGLLPNTTYYCELFAMNEVGQTSTGFPQIITTESTG